MPIASAESTDRRNATARDTLLEQFRSEMRHAPGLALTVEQASRLFNLPLDTCQRLIATLAHEGLVSVRSDGRFVSQGI
jgi:DNA-binding IclR family transcriptional regulator